MTITKVGGGVLGALLLFLLGGWMAQTLYSTEPRRDVVASYSIEVPDADAPAEEAEPVVEVAFADVFAMADADAGASLWRQCQACHADAAGVHGVGPSLHGVVGRDIASIGEFGYSDALASIEGDWTPEALNGFIANPRDWAPGTAMSYNGLDDIEDRANLIAYIDSLDD